MLDRPSWQALMAALITILTFGLFSPPALYSVPGLASPASVQSIAPAAQQDSVAGDVTTRPFHVGIQAGHWKNSELPDALARLVGSVGTSGGGRTEVSLNLDISNRIVKLLQAQGVVVDLLPATIPTGYNADAFIAIHADGSTSSSPRGFKISTRWSSSVAVQDVSLVEKLTAAYGAATRLPEDGAVTRNMRGYYAYSSFRGNWRTSALTPAAIVEMGYMSNAADRAVMFNQSDKVAAGIVTGIMSFLKSAYGTQATTRNYGYGYGLVDKNINPSATPAPTPRPGTVNGGSTTAAPGTGRPRTGNWQVVLFGSSKISVYAASDASQVIARLAPDTIFKSTERDGDYYQITLSDGTLGWVSRNSIVVQTN